MGDEQGLWLERGAGSGDEALGLPSSSHDPPWSPSSYLFDPYTLHLERLDLSPARADDSAAAGGEEHARRRKHAAAAGEEERQNGRRKRGGATAQEDAEERQRNGASASASSSRGEPTQGGPAPACQVPGCTAQLRSLPEPYYAARRICPLHSRLPCIMLAEDAVAGMDAACPRGATLLHVVPGAGCAATVGVLRAWGVRHDMRWSLGATDAAGSGSKGGKQRSPLEVAANLRDGGAMLAELKALSPKGARPPRPEPLPRVGLGAGARASGAPAPGVGGADDLLAACFLLCAFALPLAVHARYPPWRVLALAASYLAPGLLAACWRGYPAWRAPVVVACRGMQTAVSSVIPAAAVRRLPTRGCASTAAALLLSHPLPLVLPAGVARTMRFLVATRALPQMLSGMAFSLPSLWWVAAVQIGAVALHARTHGSSACAAHDLVHPQDQRVLAAALSAPGSAAGAALRRAGLGAAWLPSPAPALGDDAVCCALALWGQVVCGVLVPLAYHTCRRGSVAAAARACAALALALLALALWHGAALVVRTARTAA
eukprot:scaffold8.g1727.t1